MHLGRWALRGMVALLVASPAGAQTPLLVVSDLGKAEGFGSDADAIGDWDGDGFGDVAIGVPYLASGGVTPGSVRIVSGRDGSLLAVFSGTLPKQFFGVLVAAAGDVDADGAVDVAVGSAGPFVPPSVKVFSSATGGLLLDETVPPFTLFALDGAGDVNADGYDDIVKGGFGCAEGTTGGTNARGDATVFSGATGDVLHTWCGDGPGDHFGEVVVAAGDVNHDGYADVLVGASEADNFSLEGNGYVRVLSGLDGATLFTFEGPPQASNGFGAAVDAAGDVDDDGWPDVVAGSRDEKIDGVYVGTASIYSGKDGALLQHVLAPVPGEFFGFEVAGVGDVDGDGASDVAVGTRQVAVPGLPQQGYEVFSGADAALLHHVPLGPTAPILGLGLRAAGDLNADGLPDLLAVTNQPSAPYFWTVRALSGAPVLFADLGSALPGSQGTPHLQVEGVLAAGLPLALDVTDAPPLAPIFLVLGASATPAPYHGGVLVPAPEVLLALTTNAGGALSLGSMLHVGPPSGQQVVLQGWLPDAAAPTHFAATNAVLGTAP